MSEWARWWQSRCPATTADADRCALRPHGTDDHALRGDFGCMTWSTAWTGRLAVTPSYGEQ
jgi:hypothetical protein